MSQIDNVLKQKQWMIIYSDLADKIIMTWNDAP